VAEDEPVAVAGGRERDADRLQQRVVVDRLGEFLDPLHRPVAVGIDVDEADRDLLYLHGLDSRLDAKSRTAKNSRPATAAG
jgi:hypothetical protein